MMGLLLRFLFGFAGLWIAAHVVHGIRYTSLASLAAAAVILGIINAIVRPIVVILTLPITIVTLGLFLLVVNGLMLWLTSIFLRGFTVHGAFAAVVGAIVVSVISWLGHMLVRR
jgi:putative membrane protein